MGAPYTRLNLTTDVEDAGRRHGQAGLEARFARGALGLERSGLSHFRLDPGFRVPFGDLHRDQEEISIVLSGSARAKLDEEVLDLGPMDALRIAPGVMRGLEAGPEGAEVLAFGAPNTENRLFNSSGERRVRRKAQPRGKGAWPRLSPVARGGVCTRWR